MSLTLDSETARNFLTKLRVSKICLHFNIGNEKHAIASEPFKIFNKDSSMMWGECCTHLMHIYLSIMKFRQIGESERFLAIFLKALTPTKST